MTTQDGQLSQFVSRTHEIAGPTGIEPETGEAKPRVPFPSNYRLTAEQEEALVDHALRRLDEVERELGRDRVVSADWYKGTREEGGLTDGAETFMGKRARFEAYYSNELDWRPFIFGGIFAKSNLVVPLARRICRQMVARASNYFFSTDPWCATVPEGVEDTALAERIERYTQYKLRRLSSKRAMEKAVRLAFVRGECVVKTTHTVRDSIFEVAARVLVGADNEPILDASGDFILETDEWERGLAQDPVTGETAAVGPLVLARDGVTPQPAAPVFVEKMVTRRHVQFEGPEATPIYYKDFLCPLTAADVQQADIVAHLYDKPVMELVDLYAKRGMLTATNEERMEAVRKTIQLIRDLTNNSGAPKSGLNQTGRETEDEGTDTGADTSEPVAEIAECYLHYDANGDGMIESIMLVVDRKNRVPLFYDYTANVTPDGTRPFDVVRVGEVDGRWYGLGCMEMFESNQQVVDLMVNRWNLSQSQAGRVDFWRPDLTVEGDSDPNLKLNWGSTYTLKPGATAEDALKSVYLNDAKFESLQSMFEFFMQMAMNESGVQHANDAGLVGMETTKLATGIRNIEKSGQELFAPFLSDLEPGLEAVLNRILSVLFANLNREEVFTYLDGDTQGIERITPDEVQNLRMNVSLLLIRYRGEQQFAQMVQMSEVVAKFYTLPPEVQMRTAPFYRGMLKALDQKVNADEIISPLPLMAPPGPGVATDAAKAALAGQGPAKSEPNL